MADLSNDPLVRTALWALSIYGLVLGGKFLALRRGDARTLGVGLLVASISWVLLGFGIEVNLPLVVTLPEGPKELAVPLMRTIAEMGLVIAAGGASMVGVSAAEIGRAHV